MSESKLPKRPTSKKKPYHLEGFREREIIYYCLQYNGWKRRHNEVMLRKSRGEWYDPVQEEGDTRLNYEARMNIVEDACKAVNPEQWELLLKGVTDEDSNWYNFKLVKGLKCGRDKYYEQKHMVYYLVSQKDRV